MTEGAIPTFQESRNKSDGHFSRAQLADVNLFSDDVVIILGAGASVPFGLPTGLELIDLVASGLRKELKDLIDIERTIFDHAFPNIHRIRKQILETFPIYCAVREIFTLDDIVNKKFEFAEAKSFLQETAEWVESQVSDSIDDLIRYNRLKRIVLRICIVYEILKRSHEKRHDSYSSRNFQLRKIKQLNEKGLIKKDKENKDIELRNWIHNFINVVRNNFSKNWKSESEWKSEEEKNKSIKIVTFNYDGVLEEVLEKNWNSVESKLPAWSQVFDIVHPHGGMDYEALVRLEQLPKFLSNNAKKIAVIHDERVKREIASSRTKAKAMVESSRDLYSIGFAFARLNCVLMGLDTHFSAGKPTRINYINFDKNSGLDLRVNQYVRDFIPLGDGNGVNHRIFSVPFTNQNGQYLQITDALMGGFLGEMPS